MSLLNFIMDSGTKPPDKPRAQPHKGLLSWIGTEAQREAAPSPQKTQENDVTPTGLTQLIQDESSGKDHLSAYKDQKGIYTIGHGFNLEEKANADVLKDVTGKTAADFIEGGATLTTDQQQALLQHTVDRAQTNAKKLVKTFDNLPAQGQDAITNFVFNVGYTTARDFAPTFKLIDQGNYAEAAKHIRHSAYYKQVGDRGERIAATIESLGGEGTK